MLTASEAYQSAILPGASARRTAARVTLIATEWALTTVMMAFVSADMAAYAVPDQILNGVSDAPYRITTCEPNYWRLDGSTIFEPTPVVEVGYVSDSLSLMDCTFAVNPSIQITGLVAPDGQGLTLVFDRISDEYPVDFDIVLANGATPVYSKSVTGNTKSYLVIDEAVNSGDLAADNLTITFKKMSKPYRRARLLELYPGIYQQYGPGADPGLLSMQLTKETDVTMLRLPFGEGSIRLDNSVCDFNLISPTGVAKYLKQPGAKAVYELGVYTDDSTIEYVTVAEHKFTKWADSNARTVVLSTSDGIGAVADRTAIADVAGWTVGYDPSAYLTDILLFVQPHLDIDMTGLEYSDEFLAGPSESTVVQEIRALAQWACKVYVTGADGYGRFVDPATIASSGVDLDNAFNNPALTSSPPIGGVDVSVYNPQLDTVAQAIGTYQGTIDGTLQFGIPVGWDWGDFTYVVTGADYYEYQGFARGKVWFLVVNPAPATVTVTLSGKKYINTPQTYSINNPLTTDTNSNRVTISNKHICTEARAALVAAWTLANCNQLLRVSSNYRGNPLIEPCDMVTIETPYGDQDTVINKSSLAYSGGLRGTLEGVAD